MPQLKSLPLKHSVLTAFMLCNVLLCVVSAYNYHPVQKVAENSRIAAFHYSPSDGLLINYQASAPSPAINTFNNDPSVKAFKTKSASLTAFNNYLSSLTVKNTDGDEAGLFSLHGMQLHLALCILRI